MSNGIRTHRDLIVFQKSFAAGKRIFELSKSFPREEMYSLTDQVRRSSRSVSANIAEAWRKRRYEKHFCSTMNVAEAEAAETQVWIEYAAAHGYLDAQTSSQAIEYYDEILRMIVAMVHESPKWCVGFKERRVKEKGSEGVEEIGANYLIDLEMPSIDQFALLSPTSFTPTSPSQNPEEHNA